MVTCLFNNCWKYDVTNNKTEVSIRFIGNNTLRFASNVWYTLGTFGSTYCYHQHSNSIGQNGTGAYMADSQRLMQSIHLVMVSLEDRVLDMLTEHQDFLVAAIAYNEVNSKLTNTHTSSPNYISAGSDYAWSVFPVLIQLH